MSTVCCPHCGLHNFAISAYCARCERPMPSQGKAQKPISAGKSQQPMPQPPDRKAPAPQPSASGRVSTPVPNTSRSENSRPRATDNEPSGLHTPPPRSRASAGKPQARPTGIAVSRAFNAIETLQQTLTLGIGNTRCAVFETQTDFLSHARHVDLQLPAFVGVTQ